VKSFFRSTAIRTANENYAALHRAERAGRSRLNKPDDESAAKNRASHLLRLIFAAGKNAEKDCQNQQDFLCMLI
jgi:hypothetical protein